MSVGTKSNCMVCWGAVAVTTVDDGHGDRLYVCRTCETIWRYHHEKRA